MHARASWRKRRSVQMSRQVSDRDLWSRIVRRVSFGYYLRKLIVIPGTGHAEEG
jgi:hypothetical protein